MSPCKRRPTAPQCARAQAWAAQLTLSLRRPFTSTTLSTRRCTEKGILMAAHPYWKGFLKLSLVTVPVSAHTTTSSGGAKITLNQLHAECNSRIRYKKTCPIHGEVTNDQIVSGYEQAKGQYIVVDEDE